MMSESRIRCRIGFTPDKTTEGIKIQSENRIRKSDGNRDTLKFAIVRWMCV